MKSHLLAVIVAAAGGAVFITDHNGQGVAVRQIGGPTL